MKIKIVSDGTHEGTYVFDRDNPEVQIEGIISVSWQADIDTNVNRCTLVLLAPEIELLVDDCHIHEVPRESYINYSVEDLADGDDTSGD